MKFVCFLFSPRIALGFTAETKLAASRTDVPNSPVVSFALITTTVFMFFLVQENKGAV